MYSTHLYNTPWGIVNTRTGRYNAVRYDMQRQSCAMEGVFQDLNHLREGKGILGQIRTVLVICYDMLSYSALYDIMI